jgi:hypothetical protein
MRITKLDEERAKCVNKLYEEQITSISELEKGADETSQAKKLRSQHGDRDTRTGEREG